MGRHASGSFKNLYTRLWISCVIFLLNICHVTSFCVQNSIERNGNAFQRKRHILSIPKTESIHMKDFGTVAHKDNERMTCLVENESTLESTKAKTVLQKMSLLSALAIPLPAIELFKKRSVLLTTSFLLFSVALFTCRTHSILYPGSSRDEAFNEPLPPGKLGGCPFMGEITGFGNFNKFFTKMAKRVENVKIWKMYFFGRPSAVLSGSDSINKMLDREFRSSNGSVSQLDSFGADSELIFGKNSMSSVKTDKKEYHFQRKLVGEALKPAALSNVVPLLQEGADKAVDKILSSSGAVTIVEICKDFTFDVAWRQIIGLKFKDDELMEFYQAVSDWLALLSNFMIFFLPRFAIKYLKGVKAKKYLDSAIESKIDYLEKNGPDGSTLSSMVFNSNGDTDEGGDGPKRHLTRQQVIDNTELLILAGTETSSNTLTNAMQLLGMHPHVWEKIVDEQKQLVSRYGNALTKEQIDKECPYLEAVIKEVMRLIPVSGGGARRVNDTLVIDGFQIPKGWLAWYSIGLTHENDPITFKEDGSHMDLWKGFRPDRWLDESTRPTSEYMPFGAGNRFCLGYALAMVEMKVFLAVLARRIQFNLVNDPHEIKWKEGLILTPKDGCKIFAQSAPFL